MRSRKPEPPRHRLRARVAALLAVLAVAMLGGGCQGEDLDRVDFDTEDGAVEPEDTELDEG